MDSKQVAKQAAQRAKANAKKMAAHKNVDANGYTITQVAEVMSHTILEGIETFNVMSKKQYEDRPEACPEFKVNIVPVMFSPEHYRDTGIESRAVFTLEVKQFGASKVIFRDGMDFTCERDRKNVNAWLPRIWQRFFQQIISTSMFYHLAMNADNPEVAAVIDEKNG